MSLSQIFGNRLAASTTVLAVLSGLAVMLIWSGWIVFSRLGLQSTLTASDMTLLRFGTAALCTLPLAIRYPWKRVKMYRVLIVGLGCGFPYTLLSFYGLALNPAAYAGVIVNGSLPIVSGILCWILLKEKPSLAMAVTVVLLAIANALLWYNTHETEFYAGGVVLLFSAAWVLA
ncbi:EamA family transporter, partial [Thalassotalea sp. G20_0]